MPDCSNHVFTNSQINRSVIVREFSSLLYKIVSFFQPKLAAVKGVMSRESQLHATKILIPNQLKSLESHKFSKRFQLQLRYSLGTIPTTPTVPACSCNPFPGYIISKVRSRLCTTELKVRYTTLPCHSGCATL